MHACTRLRAILGLIVGLASIILPHLCREANAAETAKVAVRFCVLLSLVLRLGLIGRRHLVSLCGARLVLDTHAPTNPAGSGLTCSVDAVRVDGAGETNVCSVVVVGDRERGGDGRGGVLWVLRADALVLA